MYTVYKRTTPDGRVYIGCTSKTLEQRAGFKGIEYANNARFWSAIQEIGWDSIQSVVLAEVASLESAKKLEARYIKEYHALDPDFGYNTISSGFSMSPGRIESIRNQSKKLWMDSARRAKMMASIRASRQTPEYRAKLSKSICEKWKDPSYRERVSSTLRRRYADEGVRSKMVASLKLAWSDPAKRAEQSARMQTVMARSDVRARYLAARYSPEYAARIAATVSKPEVKARHSASMKKAWANTDLRERVSVTMSSLRWIHKVSEETDSVTVKRVPEELVQQFIDAGWELGRK